ncbi:MAG: rhodanese-like domain-containing protein, partial [Actinomycetota bacterium]
MAGYANPDALVDTDWLEDHIDDSNIRVIEVDEDTSAYEKGHIPGAIAWNWNTDLHAETGREYVDQAGLSRLLQQAGVGPDTTVILYGGNNNWFASYAY